MSLTQAVLVALGGAIGSVLRHAVSLAALSWFGPGFPWGTLAVNILGSAAIGVAGGLNLQGEARLLLVTGVLGGFTTFSAFSLETGGLFMRSWWLAALYVTSSVALGLMAFALAYSFSKR